MAALLNVSVQFCTCINIELPHTLILEVPVWVNVREGKNLQYRFL